MKTLPVFRRRMHKRVIERKKHVSNCTLYIDWDTTKTGHGPDCNLPVSIKEVKKQLYITKIIQIGMCIVPFYKNLHQRLLIRTVTSEHWYRPLD